MEISGGELVVLTEMFKKEVEIRGIEFPGGTSQECCAFIDFIQQYEENPDVDPHINCYENVTCKLEVDEVNWDEVYG